MTRTKSFPSWAWYSSLTILAAVLLICIGLLVATLFGVADPHPLGTLTRDDTFTDPNRWKLTSDNVNARQTAVDGHGQVKIKAGDGQVLGMSAFTILCPCTMELELSQVAGPTDVGYGVWWGNANDLPQTLVGATSDGYLAVLSGEPAGAAIRDWQLFPHIRALGQANVFRADIDATSTTIRLNDEVAVSFDSSLSQRMTAGFFIRASASGEATIQLLGLKVWETKLSGE